MQLFAAEGGWQDFTLKGGEWFILVGSALTALLAVGIDRAFYKPLRAHGVKPIVLVIGSLGVTLMLQGRSGCSRAPAGRASTSTTARRSSASPCPSRACGRRW